MGKGAAAVRGLSLRLAHRLGRQKELPEICGLQQAVLEEADVQGVCSCEKRLRQMA